MIQLQSVSLGDARRIIAAGEAKAREIGSASNIAVVDPGGNLVAHIRMDGAWIGSIDIAINKAFTARMFDLPTKELSQKAQPGAPFYGIQDSNHGRIQVLPGGLPLRYDGRGRRQRRHRRAGSGGGGGGRRCALIGPDHHLGRDAEGRG